MASHFNELNMNEIKELDVNLLEMMLSHPNLIVDIEDFLILELYKTNHSVSCLFQYVTLNSMNKFIDVFDFTDFNRLIWNSLNKRNQCEIKYPHITPNRHRLKH
ncbi:hypothetical protein TRFO_30673 [Tritrichomonas foetus]|uniref:Uncharacterized protein n=1 Tax=Tritrichomonas foetus TaxID=1144522 RepID=A0A1J4JXJ2_9EUKA|nr:hypothetical protein TRFO_30673 [Tritrichomonas foetus]|eukprot:OHT02254.1 hypothetical protein TRFO_30673 [Tritrichomonas foetus]